MSKFFGNFREKICVEGIMPERALLRLKRAGIAVYNVKKTAKDRIVFHVKKKDSEKVFAIYPNVCYNISEYTPYVAKKLGDVGLGKPIAALRRRVGLLLGGLLFLGMTGYADGLVFGVEFTGEPTYRREALALLEQCGIQAFKPYKKERVDWICSQILALDGVEYCSVRKSGLRVVVEIRTAPFTETEFVSGDMTAKHTGTVLSITALRGTALKNAGDPVRAGETLVGGWFIPPTQEERVQVQPIARARIACVYEADVEAATTDEAFAKAYLLLALSDSDEIQRKEITENGTLFHVKIEYTAIETFNV
ncbi:MAG: sporulation protein YqfD [Clostridia bacterium]|nr:sporulation protein YqfD [Clostridia bacterium]